MQHSDNLTANLTLSSRINVSGWITTISLISIGTAGAAGNLVVIIVLMSTGSGLVSKKLSNLFLLNQGFIDLFASIIQIIFAASRKLYRPNLEYALRPGHPLDEIMCKFWYSGLPLFSLFVSSAYGIVLITFERYLAVVHPFSRPVWLSRGRSLTCIGLVWGISLLFHALVIPPTTPIVDGRCMGLSHWPSVHAKYVVGMATFSYEYIIPVTCLVLFYGSMLLTLKSSHLQQEKNRQLLHTSSIIRKTSGYLIKHIKKREICKQCEPRGFYPPPLTDDKIIIRKPFRRNAFEVASWPADYSRYKTGSRDFCNIGINPRFRMREFVLPTAGEKFTTEENYSVPQTRENITDTKSFKGLKRYTEYQKDRYKHSTNSFCNVASELLRRNSWRSSHSSENRRCSLNMMQANDHSSSPTDSSSLKSPNQHLHKLQRDILDSNSNTSASKSSSASAEYSKTDNIKEDPTLSCPCRNNLNFSNRFRNSQNGLNTVNKSTNNNSKKFVSNSMHSVYNRKLSYKSVVSLGGTSCPQNPTIQDRARKKILKIMIIVGLCFILCWTPNQFYYLLTMFESFSNHDQNVQYNLSICLLCFHCCINPFIYAIQLSDFRHAFIRLCKNLLKVKTVYQGT